MKAALLLALAACTSPRGSPRGEVTVTVYSDGKHGSDADIPPRPLDGIAVFEDGGEVSLTDVNGQATVSIFSDPATIHVVESNNMALRSNHVTSVLGVPAGGVVRLGKRAELRDVGFVLLTLMDLGAPSYAAYGPGACLSFGTRPSPQLDGDYNPSCAGKAVRIYGVAFATTGMKITEQDIVVDPNVRATLRSYVDATGHAITPTNLPPLPAAPAVTVGVVDPATGLAIMFPNTDGPADANLVQLTSGDDTTRSTLLVQGPVAAGASTLDATHMLPAPSIVEVDAKHAEWSIAPSGATPNLIELEAHYSTATWTVYAPATTTRVTFPQLPASLASEMPADGASGGTLAYFELPVTALTLDELRGEWNTPWSGLRVDRQPVAFSVRSF